MARFKRKVKTKSASPVRERSLFDAIYSKQNDGIPVNAGLMSVFYNQVTSKAKLATLKRKHKRSF